MNTGGIDDLPGYDDQDEVQLMDSDATSLQLEEEQQPPKPPEESKAIRKPIDFDNEDLFEPKQRNYGYHGRFQRPKYKIQPGKVITFDVSDIENSFTDRFEMIDFHTDSVI